MNIKDKLEKIYSKVILDNFPEESCETGSNGISYFANETTYGYQSHQFYCFFLGKDGKWFAYPAKKGSNNWIYKINLFELALPDNEKFDTIEELKKHYELKEHGEY